MLCHCVTIGGRKRLQIRKLSLEKSGRVDRDITAVTNVRRMHEGCSEEVWEFFGLWSQGQKTFRQQEVELFDPSFRSSKEQGHQTPVYSLDPACLLWQGQLLSWPFSYVKHHLSVHHYWSLAVHRPNVSIAAEILLLDHFVVLGCTEVKHCWTIYPRSCSFLLTRCHYNSFRTG